MNVQQFSLATLLFCTPLCAMQEDKAIQAFNRLADRMYCIAESSGNSNNEIEKELDLCCITLRDLQRNHQLSPQNTQALFAASSSGNEEMVRLLLDAGYGIEAKNEGGQTPLMTAAFCGNADTVKFLLERGANVHATDNHGYSAKYYASFAQRALQENPMAIFSVLPKILIAAARFKDKNPFEDCEKMITEKEKVEDPFSILSFCTIQ